MGTGAGSARKERRQGGTGQERKAMLRTGAPTQADPRGRGGARGGRPGGEAMPSLVSPSTSRRNPRTAASEERSDHASGETRQTAGTSAHGWESNCSQKEEGGS